MASSENRIRMVQADPRLLPPSPAINPVADSYPFPVAGGGPGGSIIVFPTGHPQGISGPDFLAEIEEDERRRRMGRERRVVPGKEFSGRQEFEARGAMGPMRPQVPGDVAGTGAESGITDAQVAQFVGRLPYRLPGRGPGEALEGVRVGAPAPEGKPARTPQKPKKDMKVTKPDPAADAFGEPRAPAGGALAAEQADREKTQTQMQGQIAASRRGDEDARKAGYKDQQDRQDRTLEAKTVGGRSILRGQWVDTQAARYGIPPEQFYELYDKYSQGRTHDETVKAIVGSGFLRELQSQKNFAGPKATRAERNAAVQANTKQYHETQKMMGPQGPAFLANTMMGAQTPFDLAKAAAAAHALNPRLGFGNLAQGIGAEAINAEAVQGLGGRNATPVQKIQADRARVGELPIEQRAQGYRDMNRAMNAGQPHNPEQENLFLVNEGASDAAKAASAAINGTAGEGEMAFLREYTNAFTAGGESVNRAAFNKWARRLGIPITKESMSLWQKLTRVNPREYQEYWGIVPVPSAADSKK